MLFWGLYAIDSQNGDLSRLTNLEKQILDFYNVSCVQNTRRKSQTFAFLTWIQR